MLVLGIHFSNQIVLRIGGEEVRVVLTQRFGGVRLGFIAPPSVRIGRERYSHASAIAADARREQATAGQAAQAAPSGVAMTGRSAAVLAEGGQEAFEQE